MCHYSTLSAVILLLFAVTSDSANITPRLTNTCEERQTPGAICESCELLSTCIHISSGWVNIPVEMCDTENGFYCNSHLGTCSNTTGACHPFNYEGQFPCTAHGVFPDPYDCQKYHMCYYVSGTLVAASVDCGGDKAFNPANGQCTINLSHAICQQRQFECRNAGDVAAWPTNPNIYYVCKASNSATERVLYPSLYKCNDGEYFDGFYCVTGNGNGNGNSGGNSGSTTSSSSSTPPNSSTSTPDTFIKCIQKGLLSDPLDCHKYYYCSAINGVSKHVECPSGTMFSAALGRCTQGQC